MLFLSDFGSNERPHLSSENKPPNDCAKTLWSWTTKKPRSYSVLPDK